MRTLLILLILSLPAGLSAQKYADKIRLLGQQGIPYFYNSDVEANIEIWLRNDSNRTADILGKSVLYHQVVEYARKTAGLPWFIRFIPAANTGFNNNYMGADGSKGMWPLGFSIAKKYNLKSNSYLDERRNIETSADAACRYLADLQYIYRDWLKTITAFRIGAIRLNQVIRLAGNSLDFNDIYPFLTPEEREPVVQFYAAVTVMYFRHDFKISETEFTPVETDTVSTPVALPYDAIAEKTGIQKSSIRELNPHFLTDMVPWYGGATVFKLTKKDAEIFNSKKDSIILSQRIKHIPVLPQQDTVVEVRDSITYITTVPSKPAVSQPVAPDSTGKTWVWYTVKTGDGFYTLSDIFDCSIEEMKSWNNITGNTLLANSVIRFYVGNARVEHYKKLNELNHLQKREIALAD